MSLSLISDKLYPSLISPNGPIHPINKVKLKFKKIPEKQGDKNYFIFKFKFDLK